MRWIVSPNRSSQLLQTRVSSMELLLREGAGHRMPTCTLHVAVGGGFAPCPCCTSRCWSYVVWCNYSSGGPSNHPYRISRGTSCGICIGVGNGWCRRCQNGGRDKSPGASIEAGTTGAAIHADSCAGVVRQSHCCFCSSENQAWKRVAKGAMCNSLGGSPHPRGIKGVADSNSVDAPVCLVGIHWQCSLSCRGRAHLLSCPPPPTRSNLPPQPRVPSIEEGVEAG